MSSSGIQSINSGPLIIRTYNQNYSTLSTTNTYLLGQYETPIPSNYILITTLNGQLAPTNHPIVSSMNVSTLNINNGFFSTMTGCTINNRVIETSSIITSTLQVSTFANFRAEVSSFALSTTLSETPSNWWGKYIFVNPTENNQKINLSVTNVSDGIFMVFKNTRETDDHFFILSPVDGANDYTVNARSSLTVMYKSFDAGSQSAGWKQISNS